MRWEMIDAVCRAGGGVWPPRGRCVASQGVGTPGYIGLAVRPMAEILRSLEVPRSALAALASMDKKLEGLARLLVSQRHEPPVMLQALRQQLGGLMQRVARRTQPDGRPPVTSPTPALTPSVPVVIVPIEPSPERTPECLPAGALVRKRTLFWWLLGVGAVIALTCGGWWWV